MRKLIFLFVLSLTLSACGSSDPLGNRIIEDEPAKQVVEENKPVEGILKIQEYKLNMYGTHVLEDEMGALIVYLQSKKIALSNYEGSKVSVEGVLNKTYDGVQILEVNKIDVLEEDVLESTVSDEIYVSQNLGINLTFPNIWDYVEEEDSLELLPTGQTPLITVQKITNEREKDLISFVDEKDETDLTVNEFEAMRTFEGEKINVYIDTKNQNIYKIIFNPIENTATEKSEFYKILRSFALNEKKEKVKVCAGAAKIKCDSGYRCEINSENEEATGLCVKIDAEEELSSEVLDLVEKDVELDLAQTETTSTEPVAEHVIEQVEINENADPITEAELEAGFYYAQKDQKKPGTPSFWVFSGVGSDAKWHLPEVGSDADEELKKNSKFQVIDYINHEINSLVKGKNIGQFSVQGYEFSANQIVSVILKTTEKKYKIQYQYNPIDEFEVALVEIAYFQEGEGRDWEKVSGQDAQWNTEKEVITPEGKVSAVVAEDMRLYENTQQNFKLQYPKSWYYASFGAVNNTLWHTGFSNEPLELGTEVINVDILAGKVDTRRESQNNGILRLKIPRDNTTHFEIYGSTEYAATIRAMGGSVN